MNKENSLTPMLNLYPDSMGGTLKDVTQFLASDDLKDSFGSIYILPSIYNTDLDRGFSVIDYNINELFASEEDLEKIKALGLDLKRLYFKPCFGSFSAIPGFAGEWAKIKVQRLLYQLE